MYKQTVPNLSKKLFNCEGRAFGNRQQMIKMCKKKATCPWTSNTWIKKDHISIKKYHSTMKICLCQWLRGLRRRAMATRPLRLWVRIPPAAWMFVCCECCVLSGRGLCDELITHPEESYRLWRVVVCDLETSQMRRSWPTGGCCAKNKQTMKI